MITTFKISRPLWKGYSIVTAKRLVTIDFIYALDYGRLKYWKYTCPHDILDDIGAKELASRIYSVFKQHVSRPKSE